MEFFPKVYVANREYNYNEWRILGVFASEDSAKIALAKSKKNYPDNRGTGVEVEDFDLEMEDAETISILLVAMVSNLRPDQLRTLRAVINGKLSKRTISPEQQKRMQDARNMGSVKSDKKKEAASAREAAKKLQGVGNERCTRILDDI